MKLAKDIFTIRKNMTKDLSKEKGKTRRYPYMVLTIQSNLVKINCMIILRKTYTYTQRNSWCSPLQHEPRNISVYPYRILFLHPSLKIRYTLLIHSSVHIHSGVSLCLGTYPVRVGDDPEAGPVRLPATTPAGREVADHEEDNRGSSTRVTLRVFVTNRVIWHYSTYTK